MKSLFADELSPQTIAELTGLTAIRDRNGNVLGFYAPASKPCAAFLVGAAARIDLAEIQRRKNDDGRWYTTAEVLDHLKPLEK